MEQWKRCTWCGWLIGATTRQSGMHQHCEESHRKMLEKDEEEGR